MVFFFFFQAEDGIRDSSVTGVQTCALPISGRPVLPPFAHWHTRDFTAAVAKASALLAEPDHRAAAKTYLTVATDFAIGQLSGAGQAHASQTSSLKAGTAQ